MTDVTTPEQFKAEMEEIVQKTDGDPHDVHVVMDATLCRVLTELGYGDGVAIFEKQDKWYE